MKRLSYIVCALCGLLLFSCGQQAIERGLSRAEELLDTQPDSVFALLDSMKNETDDFSKSIRMHYHLLYAQAMNKTYHSLSGRDSVLQEVVDYYEWWGNANERMLANYMLGCVYRDEGNAPLALKYYREAIEEADSTSTDCDYRTLSRIYGQIADLFNAQRAPRLQLEAQRKAVDYAWQAKDTVASIIFYGNLYAPYHMMNMMDSALYYSEEAAAKFKSIGRQDLAAGTLGLNIDIYLRQKKYAKARQAMDEYEQYTQFFDQYGNIEQGRDLYYYYKGAYYEVVKRLDSAEYYYRKLLPNPSTIENREAVYKGLMSLYQKLGKADSIVKYSELYCQINDSASFTHSADEITRMQSIYNYDASERKAILHEKKANTYRIALSLTILIIVMASYWIYRFFKHQKQLRVQELIEANTAYTTLLNQYVQMQEDLNNAKLGFDKYRTDKEKAIHELQEALSSYQEESNQQKKWDSSQAMLHDAIVVRLHKMASTACKASEEEWRSLNKFALYNLGTFLDRICDEKANLTENEIRVCILSRLQFITSEMAVLLDLSKQRITNIKANTNKKLFNMTGAHTFNTSINRLI